MFLKRIFLLIFLILLLPGFSSIAQERDPFLPNDLVVITPENADQLTEVARIGDGFLSGNLIWTDDYLAAGGSLGVWFYDDFRSAPPRLLEWGDEPIEKISLTDSLIVTYAGRSYGEGRGQGTLLWNIDTGEQIAVFPDLRDPVLSPDGRFLAGYDLKEKAVTLHQLNQEEVVYIPESDLSTTWVFSPDSRYLLFENGINIDIWDVVNMVSHAAFESPSAPINDMTFSLDGSLIAAAIGYISDDLGNQDNHVYLWDADTGEQLVALAGHTDSSSNVAFSPDGHLLASLSRDGTIRLWDTDTYEEISRIAYEEVAKLSYDVLGLAFSPDGQYLAAITAPNKLRIWEVATLTEVSIPQNFLNAVGSASINDAMTLMATTSGGRIIQLWDLTNGSSLHQFTQPNYIHWGSGYSVDLNPSGTILAASGDESLLWDTTTYESLSTVQFDYRFAFLSDTEIIIPYAGFYIFDIFSDVSGDYFASGNIADIAVSRSGKFFATTVSIRLHSVEETTVWNIATAGKALESSRGGSSVAFKPDNSVVATGDGSGNIYLLDLASGGEIETPLTVETPPTLTSDGILVFPSDGIYDLAFNLDGRLLVSAGESGKLRFWDVDSTSEIAAMKVNPSEIAFRSDGKLMITAGLDGTVRFWGVLP